MTKKKGIGADWIMRLSDREKEVEDRFCLHCKRKLTTHNPNDYCFVHVKQFGREWREV